MMLKDAKGLQAKILATTHDCEPMPNCLSLHFYIYLRRIQLPQILSQTTNYSVDQAGYLIYAWHMGIMVHSTNFQLSVGLSLVKS